jgi:hypothetical protein
LRWQPEGLLFWNYWWQGFMKYAVEKILGGTMCRSSFTAARSGIYVTSRLLPKSFEKFQCWC